MAQFAAFLQNFQNINHFLSNPGVSSGSGVSRLQAVQSGNRGSIPGGGRHLFSKAFRAAMRPTQPLM